MLLIVRQFTVMEELVNTLKNINGRDNFEKFYIWAFEALKNASLGTVPYIRRVQRFLFLPYCYIFLINWKLCTASKLGAVYDLLYIFFVLKDFPDNYYQCRLWEKPRSTWKYYYGSNYNPYQRAKIRKSMQRKSYEILYENKEVLNKLCSSCGIPTPTLVTVLEKRSDLLSEVRRVQKEEAEGYRFIVKPVEGKGGHNVEVYALKGGDIVSVESGEVISNQSFRDDGTKYLVEKFIDQHSRVSEVSQSTNTVRVVTIKDGKNVRIVGAYMRFGVGKSLVDNLSRGGLAVKAELNDGVLAGLGYDRLGLTYEFHPDSLVKFDGFIIPLWSSVKDLALIVQSRIDFHKLLGMDIAITDSGPVLIEVNSIYDNIDFEQICGPILRDPEVLEVYSRCGLLYNKYQKQLLHNVSRL